MTIVLGSDHAGVRLKQAVADHLRARGHDARDLGTHDEAPTDYPDVAGALGGEVARGEARLGILVCGTGIGAAMAAGKVAGVRAAVCRTEFEARAARAHNDANVLCLGQRVTGTGVALSVVDAFLETDFEGGRHARRVDKISALES